MQALLVESGFTNEMKLEMFPLAHNSIMLRLENIGDIFDTNGKINYQVVDVQGLASGLFELVNGFKVGSESIEIEETSLTGNQPYDLMVRNKIKWFTLDDNTTNKAV